MRKRKPLRKNSKFFHVHQAWSVAHHVPPKIELAGGNPFIRRVRRCHSHFVTKHDDTDAEIYLTM